MINKRICLFTAHPPSAGGGSAILHSLKDNLPEISISWYYLAENAVKDAEKEYLGRGLMNDGLKSVLPTWRMLASNSCSEIETLVDRLLKIDCDSYWIVSHNEGLRAAMELAKKQRERPVHLTFHDDWAGALCARSLRFKLMARQARELTIAAIREVASFDVISYGMQKYYYDLSGLQGLICHRYIPPVSLKKSISYNSDDSHNVNVGHIGSIYDKNDFLFFYKILHEFVHSKGKKLILHMWGSHLKITDIPTYMRENIQLHQQLPEEQAISHLAKCNFVYSMYPASERLRLFSKTSLPTKLSTYVKAGRPILGQGPADSTIAEFLHTTKTGVLWSNKNKNTGIETIEKIFKLNPGCQQWEAAREKYFGERNLAAMRRVLVNEYSEAEVTLKVI